LENSLAFTLSEKSLAIYGWVKKELSSLRSRPPRLSESDGGQAQLECWNTGMMGAIVIC